MVKLPKRPSWQCYRSNSQQEVALKSTFDTTLRYNMVLPIQWVPSALNPVDQPSREWSVAFLERLSPVKSLDNVSPRDVIYFLIWKDKDSKTQIHKESCPHQGTNSKQILPCECPHRLAFKIIDS